MSTKFQILQYSLVNDHGEQLGIVVKPSHTNQVNINGVELGKATQLHGGWYFLESHKSVTAYGIYKTVNTFIYNIRDELKDVIDESVVPHQIKQEDVKTGYDDNDNLVNSYNGRDITHTHTVVLHSCSQSLASLEYDLIDKGTYVVNDINSYRLSTKSLSSVLNISDKNKLWSELTSSLASVTVRSELDDLLTPEFASADLECELSSAVMYKIVRNYIKQNIDHTKAKIESDYDFYFRVKKVIHTKNYIETISEWNGKSGKKSKTTIKNVNRDTRTATVFEMTWHGYGGKVNGYSGYTPIPSMKANSLPELVNKANEYLEYVILKLNADTHECPHCNGYGVLVNGAVLTD